MATEVNQNFFAWSQEETSVQDLSKGTSQMFGHGSISFGRFDLESLEWEKWSVFTNDRRHEEFGKFSGLVAKKKAYFEEYFKRIRELKALQQQNQQTELHLEYCGDGSDSSQTGEYEPAAAHGAPTESETLVDDSTKQASAATTFEHGMECYSYHENGSSANVANSCLPLTPDRCLTKKGDISTPERPSTGGRCPITSGTAVWSRAMPYYSKGAMVTEVPQKTITPRVVRSSKLENLSYAQERVELQVDRKQISSPFNLSTRKTLTTNVRDDQGLEIFKKPNKEEGVRAHAYKSNNVTPSQTGNVKTKAPVPPPLPPGRPYCTEKKPNVNCSPVGGRKPKASVPHWH